MDWLTTLRRSGGINALARQLGVSPPEVSAGVTALLPALLDGLRQLVDRRGGDGPGMQALVDMLVERGGGQLAADVMGPAALDPTPGNVIVSQAIGPEVARRAVLVEAERLSGLDPVFGDRLLPALTMLIGGYITARALGSGAAGSGGAAQLDSLHGTLTLDDNMRDRI